MIYMKPLVKIKLNQVLLFSKQNYRFLTKPCVILVEIGTFLEFKILLGDERSNSHGKKGNLSRLYQLF